VLTAGYVNSADIAELLRLAAPCSLAAMAHRQAALRAAAQALVAKLDTMRNAGLWARALSYVAELEALRAALGAYPDLPTKGTDDGDVRSGH
jgi:hypothetical protein